MFFRGSRYEGVPEAEWQEGEEAPKRYKRRRIVPKTAAPLGIVVRQGDRPDLLAYRALGDAELFWMLCDANRERKPARLTRKAGATVGVPGPEGSSS